MCFLGRRLKNAKVREYLLGDVERQYKIAAPALELIAYCMHETIAEVSVIYCTCIFSSMPVLPYQKYEAVSTISFRSRPVMCLC